MQKFPLDLQWRPLKFHYKKNKNFRHHLFREKEWKWMKKVLNLSISTGLRNDLHEGWDRTPQTHIHPNTDPHHLWPRWLWFTRVCFRLDRLYSKIHRVKMMILLSVTWIYHGSAGTPKSIWKKLTMTTMYWWFLVDIWSQIPSIHH